MLNSLLRSSRCFALLQPAPLRSLLCGAALLLLVSFPVPAQQSEPPAQPSPAQPSPAPQAAQPAAAPQPTPAPADPVSPGGITEEELKQLLIGKALYLRGGYQDNTLAFDEHGRALGHPPQGSYTLSAIEIEKIRLTKHKVELEGIRYGLHFVGQMAYEDPATAVDRVRITPKKKLVKITIDREIVVKPKKEKEKEKPAKGKHGVHPAPTSAQPAERSEADQLKDSIAEASAAERPASPESVTTTISAAHATRVLKDALDLIFAPGLDARMMDGLPGFWKLYYQAVAAKADYRPSDPAVLRQNTVDRKARLLSTFEPASNEFAQANGVAGMALYHTVIGVDGKAGEIAVGRPIGFGLDENAVAAIRNAKFEPALKDGKPVPVLLDLLVQFRIFSGRTAAPVAPDPAERPAAPALPGPYSLPHS